LPELVVIGVMINWKVAIGRVLNLKVTDVAWFACLLLLEIEGDVKARGV
jgi:hypothetical protein